MSARKSKVVKVNISAGTYKDEAEAVREANAIKRWLIRYCDKNGYSIKGKVWISTNSAYAGRVINKGRKKEYKPNGKPLPTVVEAHIHMVLFCNPASTIVDALKSYLNKKHMKAVVWDKHCNSRTEVENAVEYAMRQSRKVRTIDYDRKDVLSVDEWGYYEAVEKAEAKTKDNMAFTKSEPEQTPETLENKSVSSISDTPETLTYKSIKYNYLYYYIVPTSYSRSIIKALLQNIIYYSRDSSKSSCSKIIFKKVLLKVPHLLKKMSFYVIILVIDESEVFVLSYSYEIPKHIFQQLISLLKADRLYELSEILALCKVEFKDVGLAYYAGLKGDNWDKHALDCSLFVPENKVEQVQRFRGNLKSSLSKLLPSESGLLIRDITIIPELDSINVTLPEKNGETWEALYIDITQALLRNEPSLVLDRLHTFSVKFIREICNNKGIVTVDDKGQQYPLHSLAGMLAKYYKNNDMFESEFSEQALKTSISLFDKYNNVRNDQSFAHDNDVLNKAESALAVKIMTAVITFIEEIEKQ